jgi:hypothetical protein
MHRHHIAAFNDNPDTYRACVKVTNIILLLVMTVVTRLGSVVSGHCGKTACSHRKIGPGYNRSSSSYSLHLVSDRRSMEMQTEAPLFSAHLVLAEASRLLISKRTSLAIDGSIDSSRMEAARYRTYFVADQCFAPRAFGLGDLSLGR